MLWVPLVMISAALSPDNAVAQTLAQLEKAPRTDAVVRASGVVTAMDTTRFFVQDATGAVAVTRTGSMPELSPGDACEITGTLIQAATNLEMVPSAVAKTGTATLPAARVMQTRDASAGHARHQRVRLTGFVHEVGLNAGAVILAMQSEGFIVLITWPAAQASSALPLDLLDAQIEAEGVPVPEAGNTSVASGLRLLLPDASHLKVKRTGNADVFTRPSKTLQEMRDPRMDNGERYLMKGTVTYWSDAGWFYFTDGTSHARGNINSFLRGIIGWPYRTAPGYNPPLQPGDEIEITAQRRNLGPAMPHLVHCQWRITGKGAPPLYEPVTVSDVVQSGLDGHAVSLSCKLEEAQVVREGQGFYNHMLWAMSDDKLIQVLVQKKRIETIPLKPGDRFRAHGTVSFAQGSSGPKHAFRLNVNHLSDLALLPPPPAWQNPAMLRGIIIASAVLLFATGWIITLRRQVKAQTAQLQHQLEHEKEISEMKSRFVFTVSHEFRNPLAIIMSCSDVLQRLRGKLPPEQHERQIEGIQQSVRRMADMMEEVLLLGRADAGQLQCSPEDTDLLAFCQNLADQTQSATAGRCRVQLKRDGPLAPAAVDRSLLQHILTNLLSNAVKYSPAGSPVMLRLSQDEAASVFAVTDHGPGIPSQDQAHLFEPFHRGANVGGMPGTGLGLAIVKRCVEAHGGSIACESGEGGTTFTVRLPRPAPPASPSGPAAEDAPAIPQPA